MAGQANRGRLPAHAAKALRLLSATWRATRSPWVWTPAAVGTAGLATATVALARLLTTPPQVLRPTPPWSVTLTPTRAGHVQISGMDASTPGRWGVAYPGGAGEILVADGDQDTERPFRLLQGDAPGARVPARLHPHVWPDDRQAFSADTGIAGRDVVVAGETGPLPCWVFPAGDGRRWSVLVHGRGAPRSQLLRLVPTLHAQGVTAMVVAYRNDFPSCTDPTGRMHFGHREWLDLEAAVRVALAEGADDLVLAGMSMGGSIIKTFLDRSELAEHVVATVLDAPALDWGPVLRHCARARRLPAWLVPGVMTAAAWQAHIDWAALNHGQAPATVPTLLVHGAQDPVVPVALSDAYAQAPLVRYLRVRGAGHVTSWNAAPDRYAGALADFLACLPSGLPAMLADAA